EYYAVGDTEDLIANNLIQSDSISEIIWKRVALLSQNPRNAVASELMAPAVNSMIDIVVTREGGRRAAVPGLILLVLSSLILVSAFLSGYGSKNLERNNVLVIAFAFITTVALYLVMDLDRPRQGFVNLNDSQELLVNLRHYFIENK
ncbi:MAG TPA: hypothetical protein VFI33_05385, partial [Puia sp.]|nr:hypothetical protein [Puia sp.]